MLQTLLQDFWFNIKQQRTRAFLTMSAVAWGTMTIVLLVAFGDGLGQALVRNMRNAGNQVMIVYGGETGKEYNGLPKAREIALQEEDVKVLTDAIPFIAAASPTYGRSVNLRYGKEPKNTFCEGVNPSFGSLRSMYPIAGGRFLSEKDVAEKRNTLVLGSDIAKDVIGAGIDAIGKNVYLNDAPFTVVGVLQPKKQMGMSNGPDNRRAIIPYTTFKQMFGVKRLRSIVIRPTDPDKQEVVKSLVYRTLGRKYQFHDDDARALGIWDFLEGEKMMNIMSLGIQLFLGLIGLMTLIVAGVGIANIMYIAVKERTKEIGVRKALGARRFHIIGQFVSEAILLSLTGGMIGVAMSWGLVRLAWMVPAGDSVVDPISLLARPVIQVWLMAFVTFVLSLIGLLAGYFPARKAAVVEAAESLRYE
ncbi:MAG: ABC transporter permease [Ignavibacteria bacterium]|nr:ABC transporter permease [Ignavibacteria bacterium]